MNGPALSHRVVHGVCGFFLGAGIALGLAWIVWIPWWGVVGAGIVCAVLAFCWGEPCVDLLKEIWWWS
ncbi:MAG: hypothetical protein GXY58_17345 [Planctomycetaceae bacterium]|nr:hypothetical protein [Planctomycetaceae bacterium]